MIENDTIAAVASGMTNSGIGIIRISGSNSFDIISKIFRPKNKTKSIDKLDSYSALYGFIVENNREIDEVIILKMKAPNTYTKEDIIEIDCHGGIVILNKILNLVIKNGARLAEPGEFTKRAFLNGRIDLSQAESVMGLINSKNEFAAESSIKQLKGKLSKKISVLREKILYNIAFIESALDDPEHISLEGYPDKLLVIIDELILEIEYLLKTFDNGKILSEGINTVIVGKPNAGKSSILNVLIGEEKAIVTSIEGTTRDVLEENININGIPLKIIDTAGIRDTDNVVEKIGVQKAKDKIENADLILYVIDGSRDLDENDHEIISLIKNRNVIIINNKTDINNGLDKKLINSQINKEIVDLSAKCNTGFERLYDLINEMFFRGEVKFNDEIYINNMRHKISLDKALISLKEVKNSIELGMSEDFYTIDLMEAYKELGYIIGESVEEDLVNKIFKEFCTGK